MLTVRGDTRLSVVTLLLVGALLLGSFATSSATLAQGGAAYVTQVRVIETSDIGIAHPAGLVFSSRAKAFYVVEARGQGQPSPADMDIIKLTPFGDRAGSARLAEAIRDPINVAFDGRFNRLLIFDSLANRLIEVRERPDGNLDPGTRMRHDARHFGVQNPQGMTVDPVSGHLFILDAVGPRLVRVEPEPDGSFDGATLSEVDLRSTDLADPRGLALDPTTGHLHIVNPSEQELYELTPTGQMVTTRNLSEFELGSPQAMTFAPSGDLTDDPYQVSLYIADSGPVTQQSQLTRSVEGEALTARSGPDAANNQEQSPGAILELSFVEPAAVEATSFESTLVQIIDAWQWSPPSPDSSGITYLPGSNTLLISDGEVNEMPIFTGDNLYESTLNGNLVNTLTTISFSDEPTGVTLNPSNGHLFFSDDTGNPRVVHEMNPGAEDRKS